MKQLSKIPYDKIIWFYGVNGSGKTLLYSKLNKDLMTRYTTLIDNFDPNDIATIDYLISVIDIFNIIIFSQVPPPKILKGSEYEVKINPLIIHLNPLK